MPQDEFQFEEPKDVLRIKAKRFIAPTHDAVRAEFARRGLPAIEAEKFFHHYESCGWVVGKNKKMVGWISAVAGWEIRQWPCEADDPRPGYPVASSHGTDCRA